MEDFHLTSPPAIPAGRRTEYVPCSTWCLDAATRILLCTNDNAPCTHTYIRANMSCGHPYSRIPRTDTHTHPHPKKWARTMEMKQDKWDGPSKLYPGWYPCFSQPQIQSSKWEKPAPHLAWTGFFYYHYYMHWALPSAGCSQPDGNRCVISWSLTGRANPSDPNPDIQNQNRIVSRGW